MTTLTTASRARVDPSAPRPPAPPATPSRDAAALASVLARCASPRVLVLGCGRGTNLPLGPLLARSRHVDFVDFDRAALDAARAEITALGSGRATVAFHAADVTGLARRPLLLALDEPTFGQDRRGHEALVEALAQLVEEGSAILAATHDERFVRDATVRRIELAEGWIVDDAAPGGAPLAPMAAR